MKFIFSIIFLLLFHSWKTKAQQSVLNNFASQNSTNPENNSLATYDNLKDNLLTWRAPEYLRKQFPYYHSGFDFEDRPVWISEIGKVNFRAILERGPEGEMDLDMFLAQAARVLIDSCSLKNPEGTQAAYITDLEGFKYEYFADPKTIAFILRILRYYRKVIEDGAAYVAIINANYVTENLISIVRPVLGQVLEVVDVFGTDKAKWIPRLLRHFPRDSLPEWYGGYKNFTPIRVMP